MEMGISHYHKKFAPGTLYFLLLIHLQSFTLLLEQRLNSLIIPLPHPCSVLLLNKTSMSIAQKTHHTLAGIQISHNNIEWGEGGVKYVFHRV